MKLKRGIILLVLVLLSSSLALGFEENTDRAYASLTCIDDDTLAFTDGSGLHWQLEGTSLEQCTNVAGDDAPECSMGIFSIPHPDGCWIAFGDMDEDDECYSRSVSPGVIIAIRQFSWYNIISLGVISLREADLDDISDLFDIGRIDDPIIFDNFQGAKLCSDDHYWHDCRKGIGDDEGSIGTYSWAGNIL